MGGYSHPEKPSVAGKAEGLTNAALDRDKASLVLPAPDTKRWSSRRKAAVVVAIRGGIITREEACQRYTLSDEELGGWEVAFDRGGIPGLRITSQYSYRTATPRRTAALPFRS
jgi:hypothetical protein